MKTSIIVKLFFSFILVSVFFVSCGKKTKQEESAVLSQIMKTKVMRVGTDFVGTPFAYYVDGKPTGFEVELMEAIASELGVLRFGNKITSSRVHGSRRSKTNWPNRANSRDEQALSQVDLFAIIQG